VGSIKGATGEKEASFVFGVGFMAWLLRRCAISRLGAWSCELDCAECGVEYFVQDRLNGCGVVTVKSLSVYGIDVLGYALYLLLLFFTSVR
jgi:hypothetical protein